LGPKQRVQQQVGLASQQVQQQQQQAQQQLPAEPEDVPGAVQEPARSVTERPKASFASWMQGKAPVHAAAEEAAGGAAEGPAGAAEGPAGEAEGPAGEAEAKGPAGEGLGLPSAGGAPADEPGGSPGAMCSGWLGCGRP
jgi:hypothetical protein